MNGGKRRERDVAGVSSSPPLTRQQKLCGSLSALIDKIAPNRSQEPLPASRTSPDEGAIHLLGNDSAASDSEQIKANLLADRPWRRHYGKKIRRQETLIYHKKGF